MRGPQRKEKEEGRFCPYCEETMEGALSQYCQACKVTVFYCPKCKKQLPANKRVCPHCGAKIK